MDMASGILAAIKRGEKINSRGLSRTITKCISYFMVILSSQGFVNVFSVTDYLTWAMAFLITITEFKSLIENVEQITGTEIWKTISELMPKIKTGK
jgi:ribosomal protein S8